MKVDASPDIVDWLTLGFAGLGAVISGITAFWAIRRDEREALHTHIEWQWFGYGPEAELPFLYLYNRSATSVAIIDVCWLQGCWLPKRVEGTALRYEDPGDLSFPYEIEPGQFKKLYLDYDKAKSVYDDIGGIDKISAKLRRPYIWLKVKTMRGKRVVLPAEAALPWTDRPEWSKVQD